jgi:predicted site-specific integrase-resolvase
MPSIFPGKKIILTAMEKKLSQADLAKRFGIHRTTAEVAKQKGFFLVMAHNIGHVRIPSDRVVELDQIKRGRRSKS